ncbi:MULTISPECIES: YkvA family protein [unclassified Microcoleus]|uniref:YkvA family protein n=1 Tax=unclassified Microcoleus TaxID=2642155 RepID=UPI002FD0D3F2
MNFSIQSVYNWYRDTLRNPKYRWWIILGTLAYLVSPIDIAPDFLPVIGQIDDLAIAVLLISELSQMATDYFKSRQTETASASQATGSPSDTTASTVDVDAVSVQ